MLFRIGLSILICFCLSVSHAQDGLLHFKRIEGLSQSTGYSITKDQQGFLWIATANGLNRYDGVEIKTYKPSFEKKQGQMRGRVIRSGLLGDEQGTIWFSTDLTVHQFAKKEDQFVTHTLSDKTTVSSSDAAAPGVGVFANPVVLKNGHLWLADANANLFELNTATKKYTNYPLRKKDEAGNYIRIMYHGVYDERDRLWFASSKGLFSFNINSKKWEQPISNRSFYSLSYCQDTLYISEGKEIIWFSVKSLQSGKVVFNESGHELQRDLIHCVYTDQKFNTWVGDEKGNVYCKPFRATGFNWMGNINGNTEPQTNYPVYCFYADTSGILWVGAYMLGLMKAEINRHGFNTFPASTENGKKESLFVNTIYEDDGDNVWLGTFQKGILVLDKRTGKTVPLQLPYTGPPLTYGSSVPLIQPDSRGNLWTSMSGYLYVRESGSSKFLPIKLPPPSNALQVPQLWSFAEYKEGWLLGTTVGLYYLFRKNNRYEIQYLPYFGQTRISGIWVQENNSIWIAFESGGLTIAPDLEKPDAGKRLFPETNVKSFLHDPKHQLLWISTSGGLIAYHLPSGQYKNFTEEEGLLNSYVFGAILNADELWISTNYGLSRAAINFKKGADLPDLRFTNFTSSDGLPDNQFNNWSFYKGKTGYLYFGTLKGITWFKPQEIRAWQDVPLIQMIDLLVNEKKADSAIAPEYIHQLVLPYFKNSLFFRFRGISYTNVSEVHYAYKLEGWDKDWIYSGTLNEVRYNNLPHGHYQFQVRAANGSGVWGEKVYTVDITIDPPFWKTWWFYWLVGSIILVAAVLLTKLQVQQKFQRQLREIEKQRAIEAERNRISKDMHDEIGSGLTHIALMSELIQTGQKTDHEIKKDVSTISQSARKLVQSMSEIVWALNPQNEALESLLAYLREQAHDYFEPFDVDFEIDFPETIPALRLTNEQRRNLFLVLKEALHNALKHAEADRVSLHMAYDADYLSFAVKDNGKGISSPIRASANGLRNMEKRMMTIKGTCAIQSGPGGTTIHFSLPLKRVKE